MEGNLFFRPSTMNSVAEVKSSSKNKEVAFLIGNGFDMALASMLLDSKGSLNFNRLTSKLYSARYEKTLKEKDDADLFVEENQMFHDWHLEILNYCSLVNSGRDHTNKVSSFLGSTEFQDKVSSISFKEEDKKPDHAILKKFFRNITESNLIITTNYTSFFEALLNKYLLDSRKGTEKKRVIVYERERLSSGLLKNDSKDTITLIYLHGRFNSLCFPIIDATGYNIIAESDRAYKDFLLELFTCRSVVSFGYSWTDFPLKSAVALSQRVKTFLFRRHLFVDFVPPRKEKDTDIDQFKHQSATSIYRNCDNSLKALYGLDKVYIQCESSQSLKKFSELFDVCEKPSVPSELETYIQDDQKPKTEKDRFSLHEINRILEENGDYESPVQRITLLKYLNIGNEKCKNLCDFLTELYQTLNTFLEKKGQSVSQMDWLLIVQIERHLRHYVYMYNYQNRNTRSTLWKNLYKVKNLRNFSIPDPKLRFDFSTGYFETQNCRDDNQELAKLKEAFPRKTIYQDRLELCPHIWRSKHDSNEFDQLDFKTKEIKLLDLYVELLKVGWESIASKIILDLAVLKIADVRKKNEEPDDKFKNLLFNINEMDQAKILEYAHLGVNNARFSGYFRREVKGEVICAMYSKTPSVSRLLLLDKYKAMKEREIIEPGLIASILAGISACVVREISYSCDTTEDLEKHIKTDLFISLFNESGFDFSEIIDSDIIRKQYEHWRTLSSVMLPHIFASA